MYRVCPIVVTIKLRFDDSTSASVAVQLALRVLRRILRPDKSSKRDAVKPPNPRVIEINLSDKTQLYQ